MMTKQILKSLRNNGLTAKAGHDKGNTPAAECANVNVLSSRVLNVNTFSILGFGCIDHQRYETVKSELCSKVEVALNAIGVSFTKSLSDQYIIN